MKKGFYVSMLVSVLLLAGCGKEAAPVEKESITMEPPMRVVDQTVVSEKLGNVFREPENAKDITYKWDQEAAMAEMICYIDGIRWEAYVRKADDDASPVFWTTDDDIYDSEDNFGMGKSYQWNGIEGVLQYYFIDGPYGDMAQKYACIGDWMDEENGYMYTLTCISPQPELMDASRFFMAK